MQTPSDTGRISLDVKLSDYLYQINNLGFAKSISDGQIVDKIV